MKPKREPEFRKGDVCLRMSGDKEVTCTIREVKWVSGLGKYEYWVDPGPGHALLGEQLASKKPEEELPVRPLKPLKVDPVEFEKRYGSTFFIKTCGSALNRLLVEKGLVTEQELIRAFEHEAKRLMGLAYRSDYGDFRTCECGHGYIAHFDPRNHLAPVGCRDCNCQVFRQKPCEMCGDEKATLRTHKWKPHGTYCDVCWKKVSGRVEE